VLRELEDPALWPVRERARAVQAESKGVGVSESDDGGKVRKTDEEWRAQLTPDQYVVTGPASTESPFSGQYCDTKTEGLYRCVCCGAELFRSETKYESSSGWPSYYEPVAKEAVREESDTSLGMVRTEVTCSRCDAHLGHVFPDGPEPTGQRYCINSLSLDLDEDVDE